ncbi:MAG: hypothetical protein MZU79_08715 [Anaerotruncus sp.]|nr:hypothetical protein [Anaerotruncus sp.]
MGNGKNINPGGGWLQNSGGGHPEPRRPPCRRQKPDQTAMSCNDGMACGEPEPVTMRTCREIGVEHPVGDLVRNPRARVMEEKPDVPARRQPVLARPQYRVTCGDAQASRFVHGLFAFRTRLLTTWANCSGSASRFQRSWSA